MTREPQEEQIEVVRATSEHLEQITQLARSRSLSDRGGAQEPAAVQSGFLVSAYTEADYRARLDTAEHFYVAVKGTDVLGFLLAYTSDQVERGEWLNRRIKTTLGDFLVIKQVCVSRDAARGGIGSLLYYHLLEGWTESPVIAAVVNEPPNEASAGFHHKLGFQELTRLTPPDGMPRVVWIWRKPRESMLQTQYSVSVDLYKHEDSTNWQKLNNFFYITVGLAAATAFSVGKEGAGGNLGASLAIIISTIGFCVSVGFSQMLRFGHKYLLARKAALMEIEEHMAWHGGQPIVNWHGPNLSDRYLKRSPTGLIMVLLPIVVAAGWAGMLGALIVTL